MREAAGADDSERSTRTFTVTLRTDTQLPNWQVLSSTSGRRVAWVSASVTALEALRWAKRAVEEHLSLGFEIGELALNQLGLDRHGSALAARRAFVRLDLPYDGAPMLATMPGKVTAGRHSFDWSGACEHDSGSRGHAGLLTALEDAAMGDEGAAEVQLILIAAGLNPGERDRELGTATLDLATIFADPSELKSKPLSLFGGSGGGDACIGTLGVSTDVLGPLRLDSPHVGLILSTI